MRSSPDDHLWAVILAGGVGARFWPASTRSRPKQLLRLASEQPLIRDTVERIRPLVPLERVRILTAAQLAEPMRAMMPELGREHFYLEPRAAGTAPALAWAAAEIERVDPNAIMVSLHADHVIEPAELFRQQIGHAARLAATHRRLFTLGAVPDRPEPGYGYIRVGPALTPAPQGPEGGLKVERFVEKPNVQTANAYLAEGGYLWNTGIFVWCVRDLLDQLERHTPEIAKLIPLVRQGDSAAFFEQVQSISIDEGLLERSDRVAVLRADFRWDDIGAWDALFRTHPLDDHQNALIGEAFAVESRGSALYADDGPVVAFGVKNLVIVRTSGITFVAARSRVAELKQLLAQLPEKLRILE
jgi:mannose-1-phosphate guanylyltransferase